MSEIYIIASGKGGVGKSTFAAGVSRELAYREKKVLAVDCDIGLRSLDLLLNCAGDVVFNWGDVITNRCAVNEAIVKAECGVDFLAAPLYSEDEFTPESFKDMIDGLSPGYDFIFLDAPAGIGSGFALAAGAADKGIIITTPDSVCVRSCARAGDELKKAGLSELRLLVNMFEIKPTEKSKLLNIDECIDETRTQLLGIIPLDRSLAFQSVTGEEPGEFSPSAQAFDRITGRLLGENVELVFE